MSKIRQSILALMGYRMVTLQLKVAASAALEIKNTPPLGLLRGH